MDDPVLVEILGRALESQTRIEVLARRLGRDFDDDGPVAPLDFVDRGPHHPAAEADAPRPYGGRDPPDTGLSPLDPRRDHAQGSGKACTALYRGQEMQGRRVAPIDLAERASLFDHEYVVPQGQRGVEFADRERLEAAPFEPGRPAFDCQ